MATARDVNFADAAVESGLVTREQAEQSMAEMKLAESIGAEVTLDAVMVKKGLLTRLQADELLESLARKKVPKRLAGFDVLETIARGGMCTVFKARQISMDRIVALKVLSPRLASDKRHTERLFKEARSVAMLSHVNIIQGFDVGEASGYYYFAAEYVDGESVAAKLARERKLLETEALNITEQIALALSHIHSAVNMVHGDIKPANIVMTKTGVAKLADLGLARVIGQVDPVAAGTPHYISPEQARNVVDVDIRSDIYSLGATLFHMVTGNPPYGGANPNEIIANHLTSPIPSPRILTPELSAGICSLITRMLAKERDDRYQTPDELLQDIRKVRSGMPLVSLASPVRARAAYGGTVGRREQDASRKWLMPVIGGLAAAAVLAVVLVLVLTKSATPPPKTNVAPPPTPAVIREKQAEGAFAALVKFERENPAERRALVDRCQEFAKQWSGTSFAVKANQMADAAFQRDDKEADSLFQKAKAEAKQCVDEQRFSAATAAWKRFPGPRFLSKKWQIMAGNEITVAARQASQQWDEVSADAGKLAEQGQYDKALEMLATVVPGMADIDKLVEEKKAEYRAKVEKRDEKQPDAVQDEFNALLRSVARYELGRSYSLALQACDRFLAQRNAKEDGQPGSLAEEARYLKREIENARDVRSRISASLAKTVGQPLELRVGGILYKGTVLSAAGDTFTLDIGGKQTQFPVDKLGLDHVLQLAGLTETSEPSVIRRIMFLLASGEVDKAGAAVGELPEEARPAWQERLAVRIATAKLGPEDKDADSALQGLRDLAAGKKWRPLLIGTYRFKARYGQTAVFADADAEYKTLRLQAEGGICEELGIQVVAEGDFLAIFDLLRECVRWETEHKCPKEVKCADCKGVGSIESDAVEFCTRCQGAGRLGCSLCLGHGHVYDGRSYGDVPCGRCRGSGRVPCSRCKGSGRVNKMVDCPACNRAKKVACPRCNGTGWQGEKPAEYTEAQEKLTNSYPRQKDAILKLAAEE